MFSTFGLVFGIIAVIAAVFLLGAVVSFLAGFAFAVLGEESTWPEDEE